MRLSVATNFDPALVDALRGYPVVELFRSLDGGAMWRYLPGVFPGITGLLILRKGEPPAPVGV